MRPNLQRSTWRIVELRARDADGDKPPTIGGYGAVFDTLSEDFGGWRERIAPGAFSTTLADSTIDVMSLYNHRSDFILGRQSNGTLRLEEDARGLLFEVDVPPTSWATDLVASMRRGDVRDASFAFAVTRDSWDQLADTPVRTLHEVKLYEVGPVTWGAYPAAESIVRDLLGREDIAVEIRSAIAERNGLSLPRPAQAGSPATAPQAGRRIDHLRRRLALAAAS
jgi:hypothetical protein